MNLETFKSILNVGETVAVEFKRCGNGIEHDVYESVCAFLNRFGGDLFLGVLDNGTVVGSPLHQRHRYDHKLFFYNCVLPHWAAHGYESQYGRHTSVFQASDKQLV